MTLIIAGIQESGDDEFPDDHGFCVADGMASNGSRRPVTLLRQKMEELIPRRKIGAGGKGSLGYASDDPIPGILLAQAGPVLTSSQIKAIFTRYLDELYVCWDEGDPILRRFTNKDEIWGLPEYHELPPGPLPLLDPAYAVELLKLAVREAFADILKQDDLNAVRRFEEFYGESLLMARNHVNKKIELYKLEPSLHGSEIAVEVYRVGPGKCTAIGATRSVRSRLAAALSGVAAKKDYALNDLCLVTLLKIAQGRRLKGVGGEVSLARCESTGDIKIRRFDTQPWKRRAPEKRDHTFWDRINLSLD